MNDPLLSYRDRFSSLGDCIHLVSHSLGAVPDKARDDVMEFMDAWKTRSITAWDQWLPEVEHAGNRIGKLLGAPEGSVIMHTNVSVIQATLASAFDYTPDKNGVVYTDLNFPSVSYVWKAEERRGAKVTIVSSTDGVGIDTDALCAAIDERTLVVPISHVLFRSSYIQDARKIIRRAHEVGAYVVLDCYQSLGAVPFDVTDLDVDFACGGSVKWLCGGPGAAYLYVKPALRQKFSPKATGWFAHRSPFAFEMPEQDYADSIWRYVGGTPAVLALYQARAGHELLGEIGVDKIREKSLRMTSRIIEQVDDLGFTLRSPRDADRRGGTVVLDFEGSGEVTKKLNQQRIFCDHRPGGGIRISPHFYTKDEELDEFFATVQKLR